MALAPEGVSLEHVRSGVFSVFFSHTPLALMCSGFVPLQAALVPLVGLTTMQAFGDIERERQVSLQQCHVLVLGASGGTGMANGSGGSDIALT